LSKKKKLIGMVKCTQGKQITVCLLNVIAP
jgi:hypothetical protein